MTQFMEGTLYAFCWAKKAIKITDGEEFPLSQFLIVGSPGTATLTFLDDTTAVDFPLKEGLNLVACKKINVGSAADIWAMY